MLRYAITSGTPLALAERKSVLVHQAAQLAREGIDYLQLREKDLSPESLEQIATAIIEAIHRERGTTSLLLNLGGPQPDPHLAIRCGVAGVHLPSTLATLPVPLGLLVSISCHTLAEVEQAVARNVDLILFGPVFGKQIEEQQVSPSTGLPALHAASITAHGTPVLALGGITQQNAIECLDAGATGIAAIRLFAR